MRCDVRCIGMSARADVLYTPLGEAPAGLCPQDIMDIGRMWYHYPFVIELRKKWEARELERVPAARCPAAVPAPWPCPAASCMDCRTRREDHEGAIDLAHGSDADVVTEIELYDEKNKMHPLPVALSRARFC